MISRRQLLAAAGCGFGSLAFGGLSAFGNDGPKRTHHAPKAKRVIFLFMQGGVSHVDSFDHKPRLAKDEGKMMPFDDARTIANGGQKGSSQRLMKGPWTFAQHGQVGKWASNLFPEMNRHVDKMCFIHSMHTDGVAHVPATLLSLIHI